MEQFLNKEVRIRACLGAMEGSGMQYTGIVTSCDDEFLCLNNKEYIVRKFIMSITLK